MKVHDLRLHQIVYVLVIDLKMAELGLSCLSAPFGAKGYLARSLPLKEQTKLQNFKQAAFLE